MTPLPARLALLSAVTSAALLAGCCSVPATSTQNLGVLDTISGKVHGGQQPVFGAVVTLYAPGITGYGSAPTVLATAVTGLDGSFTLPRPYTCVAGSPITYIVATGGNPGAGVNPLLAEAAVLPACSALTASTSIYISEVTTVAAAYVLAPFATFNGPATNIGTSASNIQGLLNALGPATNLASTTTGNANPATTFNPNFILPTSTVNTLANILAACVNTNVVPGTTTACATLLTNATPPGGVAPANTFQAAIDIALNPGNNAPALYALSNASPPYQPALTSAPGDFALAIQYIGGQIGGSGFTSGLAIDAQGNAWVGNAVGNNPKSISKISPAGVFLSGTSGFANGIAGGNGFSIDATGNVFTNVAALNETLKLNSAGTILNQFTTASLVKPTGLAVDNRTGYIWSANSNNQPSLNNGNSDFTGTTVTAATGTGVDTNGSPYTGLNGPFPVEIDGLGNVWVASTIANTTGNGLGFLTRYAPPATTGQPYTAQNIQTGANSLPFELSFDSANNVYVALVNSVGKYSNTGALLGNFPAGATNFPTSVMVDGLGRIFVSNNTAADFSTPGSLTVFSPTGTLLSTANGNKGYLAGNTIPYEPFTPTGLAIDGSGNVWISGINFGSSNPNQYVTEIIGIAAPITTPTTVESSNNTYGTRP